LHPFGLGESGATVPPRRDERGRLPALPAAEKLHLARLVATALGPTGESPHRREAVTALLGRAWHVVAWDHRFETVDHLPLIGEALVLCPSGVSADASASPAAELRAAAAAVRATLGTKSLRAVELGSLPAARTKLSPREFAVARYLVGENTRAVAGERWLRADDHPQFGQLLWESHDSQREDLSGSSEELDALGALARTFRGTLGARASGGGATLNLVAHHEAHSLCTHLAEGYERLTGIQVAPRVCQLVDGSGH
jgi:galactokinase